MLDLHDGELTSPEIAVKLEIASECCWTCELRYTAEPNRQDHQPDRSVVYFAAGGGTAEDVLARCLESLRDG